MPLYEFLCVDCERIFELIKPISQADVPTPCTTCGAVSERLIPSSFTAFTMRDGYPRRVPDNGQPYGPIGPYTTGATPEQKAKAMAEERRMRAELRKDATESAAYRSRWSDPKESPSGTE